MVTGLIIKNIAINQNSNSAGKKTYHFSEAVTNLKDTKSIWKHLRTANKKTSACDNALPDELEINGQQYTNSQDIAFKLNDYFASISEYINTNDVITSAPDLTKLETYISSKNT